jgi:uncharacterized protein (DUF2252 family)
MLEEMVAGYTGALESQPSSARVNESMPDSVRSVIARSRSRKWKHLARERIDDVNPTIPFGKRFWALTIEEKAAITTLFASSELRTMATSLSHRAESSTVTVLDAAYWMKGCSSLGIKEAVEAAAPRSSMPIPRNNAERVVTGARAMPHSWANACARHGCSRHGC